MTLFETKPKTGVLAALLILVTALLSPKTLSLDISPYIGVDQQINIIRFKEGYGNSLFKKHHPQGNLYAGVRFNDIFGIELGRTSARSRDRLSTIYAGGCCLGTIIPYELEPVVCKSCSKISGYHLGGTYTYSHDSWENLRISYGVGAAFLKAEAERKTLHMSRPPVSGSNRIFQKKKVVLRLMVAPEYKIFKHFGIRSSICFLNTRAIIIKAEPMHGAYTPIIKLKDSFVYSLGVFFEF